MKPNEAQIAAKIAQQVTPEALIAQQSVIDTEPFSNAVTVNVPPDDALMHFIIAANDRAAWDSFMKLTGKSLADVQGVQVTAEDVIDARVAFEAAGAGVQWRALAMATGYDCPHEADPQNRAACARELLGRRIDLERDWPRVDHRRVMDLLPWR